MRSIILFFFISFLFSNCLQKNKKDLKFNKNATSDITCLKERENAMLHFKNGVLTYCNYSQFPFLRCEKKMEKLLQKNTIYFVNEFASDVIIEGQREDCYCSYMKEQIEAKYGKKFIDSLLYVADSIFISKNLDKVYELEDWDKPPIFPGDKKVDRRNHSGLQAEFEKLVHYPDNYVYKTDENSLAMAKIDLDLDEKGKAKAKIAEFIFWNSKMKKDNFNYEVYKPFEKIIIQLIEQTKWAPAKIKSFNVKSKSEIFIYFK